MPKSSTYDYIICGAGCAGLSLLMRMIQSGSFQDKKILLIDKEAKTKNDRTWCYWEMGKGFFESIVYKKWNTVSFLSNNFSSRMDIAPYEYKMIRGIDFYKYCFTEIAKHSNVEILYGQVNSCKIENETAIFIIDNKEYQFGKATIFNSVYEPGIFKRNNIRLLQHFKGWIIETGKPAFKPGDATMMDFRVSQEHGTTFTYVLPFTSTTALVEYTLFTKELLPSEEYDKQLTNYIQAYLGITDYTVKETEFGVIPMTNEKFQFEKNGWQIGTAGGQTKASSGYTFQFIQKQSQQIIDCLIAGKSLNEIATTPKRFRFYDNTLLHILYHEQLPGDKIFTQLFQKNKPQQMLRFLDNESSIKDELKIISSLPTWPFLKAALKQL